MGRWIAILVWILVCLGACGDGHVGESVIDAAVHDASGDGGSPCAGLDLDTCRATSGCVADVCPTCTCGQTFEGCREAADAPAECPDLLCPEPTCCGTVDECTAGDECYHPGESRGCAIPNPDPGDCTFDGECDTASGEICEPIPCSQTDAFHCVMGCSVQADCPIGTECNPEHRCTSAPCNDTDQPC